MTVHFKYKSVVYICENVQDSICIKKSTLTDVNQYNLGNTFVNNVCDRQIVSMYKYLNFHILSFAQ